MSSIISQIDSAENRIDKSQSQRTQSLSEISKMLQGETSDWRLIDRPSRYRTRLERLGLHKEADAITDSDAIDFNPLERILGESQLTGIEFIEKGITTARAVARVNIIGPFGQRMGYGSGFMISPRLLMTNNHVISSASTAVNSFVEFDYLKSSSGLRDALPFSMDPSTFFITDEDLDFTIIALMPINATGLSLESRGWCPLIANSGKVIVGERVNIIQHPGGERMQITLRDNAVIGLVDSFLHYRADTLPGSSGSIVANDQWEVAALHHAGKPKRDSQGRILMTNGLPWTGRKEDVHRIAWEANEGVRISEIVRNVNSRNLSLNERRLWEQTNSQPETLDIWSLYSSPNIGEGSTDTGSGLVRVEDDNSRASWLFRLSFGPESRPRNNSPSTIDIQKDSRISELPSTDASKTKPNGLDVERLAEDIVERFRHDGLYYDEADDQKLQGDYWSGIDLNANSGQLFQQLNQHLENTHTGRFSYSRARLEFLYPVIDLHEDNTLRNIYSGNAFSPAEAIARELEAAVDFGGMLGIEFTENFSFETLLENEDLWLDLERSSSLKFNCEHVVCQSWFDKRQPMKADIHHLFACEPGCNSFRSNIPYWQFPIDEEAVRTECGRREENKFEPEHGKGAVARATMYFIMRYPGEVGDERSELTKSRVDVLLDWHQAFPPDNYEKHRNWLTHKVQGNRNPFIDTPDLATKALLKRGFG